MVEREELVWATVIGMTEELVGLKSDKLNIWIWLMLPYWVALSSTKALPSVVSAVVAPPATIVPIWEKVPIRAPDSESYTLPTSVKARDPVICSWAGGR